MRAYQGYANKELNPVASLMSGNIKSHRFGFRGKSCATPDNSSRLILRPYSFHGEARRGNTIDERFARVSKGAAMIADLASVVTTAQTENTSLPKIEPLPRWRHRAKVSALGEPVFSKELKTLLDRFAANDMILNPAADHSFVS